MDTDSHRTDRRVNADAEAEADHIAVELQTARGDARPLQLESAARLFGEMAARGHLDPAAGVDRLHYAAVCCGLSADIGVDELQRRMSEAWRAGEQEALEELAAAPRDAWDDPDATILEDRRGPLPPFPVDVMPGAWQPWLQRYAHGAGVRPDHVALPLLAIAAGLIGSARRVQAARGFSQPLCLWTAVVGFSGTGKTPGLAVSRRELSRIERSRSDSIDQARAAHEKRAAEAKASLRAWKRAVQDAVEDGKIAPDRPPEANVPPDFVAARFFVSDTTIERLAVLMEARPRGMLLIADELAGLFANMGRYSRGGSDREFWLEAWVGDTFIVERLSRPPIALPHLLCSMTGGFQPDKLAAAFKLADGMAARVLFGWPTEPEYKPLSDDVGEESAEAQEAFRRLIDLPAGTPAHLETRVLPLTTNARQHFETFRHETVRGQAALDGLEREWRSKGPGQVLRLAGTLAYLDWAMPAMPTTGTAHERLSGSAALAAEPTTISEVFVDAAVRLWSTYCWPHARAVLRQTGINDRHREARRALLWIRAQGRTDVSAEDIRRDALSQRLDAEQTASLLELLVARGWLRKRAAKATGRGRPAYRWDVNPKLAEGR